MIQNAGDILGVAIQLMALISIPCALLFAILYIKLRDRYVILKHNRQHYFANYLQKIGAIFRQRTGLTDYVFAIESRDSVELKEILQSINKYVSFCVEETKEIFELYTGERCACTVKLLDYSQSNTRIYTYARDYDSSRSRSETDKVYPILEPKDHSPFEKLLSDPSLPRGFVSNDLSDLEKEQAYSNLNPNWKKQYNATCIVPIASTDVDGSKNVIGFLCIDSMRGRFDQEFSIVVLEMVAGALYYSFETLAQLNELYSENNDESVEL